MARLVQVPLSGGPLDGETFEIHPDKLKIQPLVSFQREDGEIVEYRYNGIDQFLWVHDPTAPEFQTGVFVFDDDGNRLSEEATIEDAMDYRSDLERQEQDSKD